MSRNLKRTAYVAGIIVASIIGGITSALAMAPFAAVLFSAAVVFFGSAS